MCVRFAVLAAALACPCNHHFSSQTKDNKANSSVIVPYTVSTCGCGSHACMTAVSAVCERYYGAQMMMTDRSSHTALHYYTTLHSYQLCRLYV
jgi:hypothetical protein